MTTTYKDIEVQAINIHYVEAGEPSKPTILLLHGFPSDSNQFRDLIPLLSQDYHILAPDLPGFGLTASPPDFKYTFENMAFVIGAWLDELKVMYAMYIFDYGAPVGLRLALRNPSHVKAIISQNGNAYDEGFGQDFWAPLQALWKSGNAKKERQVLIDNALTLEFTKWQYTAGVTEADIPKINPLAYLHDYKVNLEGIEKQERQVDIFYDYRTNPAMYLAFHDYFRKSQVPLLAIWGKNDPCFIAAGAEAFKKDLPDAEVVLLDAGHFAIETHKEEIAERMIKFLKDVKF